MFVTILMAIQYLIGSLPPKERKKPSFPRIKSGVLNNTEMPTKWKVAGKVAKLYIYPIKSCRGNSVDKASVSRHGLTSGSEDSKVYDRRFVVVNKTGNFLTARRYPGMVLIELEIIKDSVVLKAPGMNTISVDLPKAEEGDRSAELSVRAKGQKISDINFSLVPGENCQGLAIGGPELSTWLSEYITGDRDFGLRLMYHIEDKSSRPNCILSRMVPKEMFVRGQETDTPYYADGFGFMMLSDKSVERLNEALEQTEAGFRVEERRFRPNIFITDVVEPFAEDSWPFIKINDVVFRNVAPCPRCVFTTVDPVLGQKNQNLEPLATLKDFRLPESEEERKYLFDSPYFGVYLGINNEGTIAVGDAILVGEY